MSRLVTVLLSIAGLCILGVWIALKMQQANANKARTEKARQTELERRARVREEKAAPAATDKTPDLFSSADVELN